jgi:hypothetical protein
MWTLSKANCGRYLQQMHTEVLADNEEMQSTRRRWEEGMMKFAGKDL